MPGRPRARPGEGEPPGPATTPAREHSPRREVTTKVKTAPTFASASEAMEMVHAGLGYLAAADATAMAAETQAQCLRMLEQAHSMGTAARTSILAAFTAGQGYSRGCGLQSAGVADQPDPHHQGRRGRPTPRGSAAPPRIPRSRRRWPPGRCRSRSPGRSAPGPTSSRRTARRTPMTILLARRGERDGPAGPGRAGRGDLRPVPAREPGRGPGSGVRGPVRQAGDHVRGRGGAARGPDPGVRVGGGARCWMRCRPRQARRTPAARRSGSTTRLQEAMRPLCFCIMMDSWTAHRQTGRKPSSGRACTPA